MSWEIPRAQMYGRFINCIRGTFFTNFSRPHSRVTSLAGGQHLAQRGAVARGGEVAHLLTSKC